MKHINEVLKECLNTMEKNMSHRVPHADLMCRKPSGNASYRPYKALENKAMDKDELKSRIAKMREDLKI